MLQQSGLYYPYIHFRDDSWLKAAALYWPRLGRVVPAGYPVMDSRTVGRLTEALDFVHDVDPAAAARTVADDFLDVLTADPGILDALRARHADYEELRGPLGAVDAHSNRFRDRRASVLRDPAPLRDRPFGLAGVYQGEVDPRLRAALLDGGLAVATRSADFREVADAGFLAMSPELAWVYKCALTEQLACLGGYAPTTDRTASHTASQGWNPERIERALLGRPAEAVAGGLGQDLTGAVGMLAVRIVLPADLHHVDVEKIIALRTDHGAAFERFGRAVTDTAASLKEDLAEIRLPEAARRYVVQEVDQRFRTPLAELEDAMRSLNFDTTFSAANMSFTVPPAVGLLAGQFAGHPLVATSLGAAFALVGVARSAHREKQAALAAEPAAYLLKVQRELAPRTLLGRVANRVRARG
ncbi:DUF6236 family protein [Streptomyces sp. NPDC091273]|uniref:DUF6236 family protein n=1 Tax=Streptomyces sp. NPDC091273 TaxID=3365982 RepID=UPI00382B3178